VVKACRRPTFWSTGWGRRRAPAPAPCHLARVPRALRLLQASDAYVICREDAIKACDARQLLLGCVHTRPCLPGACCIEQSTPL
jgi:hypothetical protein